MFGVNIPTKFPVPFASSAPVGGIRAIPTTPGPVPGAAALTTGFPPLTFIQPSVGGIPPDGRDMNGILNQLSAWSQWGQAGGPNEYDAAFATSIGGYPRGALIKSTSGHAWYECLADANLTNPNLGGANWCIAFSPWSAVAWTATGSANVQNITLSPVPTSIGQLFGIPIPFFSQGTNTAPVLLNFNGLGAIGLLQANGLVLGPGALVTGGSYVARFNGSGFFLTSQTSVFTDSSNGGVAISGAGNANGANLALLGSGGTTPNKYIRALGGLLQFLNSSYTSAIATLNDIGNFSILGNFSSSGSITAATGNVTASTGRLRAGLGASGSGDANAASILADFPFTIAGTQPSQVGYTILPNGFIIQWGVGTIAPNTSIVNVTFPLAFPTSPISVMVNKIAPGAWLVAGRTTVYAVNGMNNSQAQVVGLIWNTGSTSWAASDVGSSGISFRYWAIGY